MMHAKPCSSTRRRTGLSAATVLTIALATAAMTVGAPAEAQPSFTIPACAQQNVERAAGHLQKAKKLEKQCRNAIAAAKKAGGAKPNKGIGKPKITLPNFGKERKPQPQAAQPRPAQAPVVYTQPTQAPPRRSGNFMEIKLPWFNQAPAAAPVAAPAPAAAPAAAPNRPKHAANPAALVPAAAQPATARADWGQELPTVAVVQASIVNGDRKDSAARQRAALRILRDYGAVQKREQGVATIAKQRLDEYKATMKAGSADRDLDRVSMKYSRSLAFREAVLGRFLSQASLAHYRRSSQYRALQQAERRDAERRERQAAVSKAVDRQAIGVGKTSVFGLELGEVIELEPCERDQSSKSLSQECRLMPSRDTRERALEAVAMQKAPLPRGVRVDAVQLPAARCPNWVADCMVSVVTSDQVVVGVGFHTSGASAKDVEAQISEKYGSTPSSRSSICSKKAAALGERSWEASHLRIDYGPVDASRCDEGRVVVSTKPMQALPRAGAPRPEPKM